MTLALTRADIMIALFPVFQVLWIGAFGACVGSLLNVLVYRLPLGLDVVTPSSRCPNCETRLTWRENIPIFGWLALRGRCRFCRVSISSEYPIVEAFTAFLWALVFVVLYAERNRFFGVPVGTLGPSWGDAGFRLTWPTFVLVVSLFSCLIAVTLIDARTFHIPMALVVVPVVLALLLHPLHAFWVQYRYPWGRIPSLARGWDWTIATPGPHAWRWVGASLGAALGLTISNVLLATGRIGRSFSDYDAWLKSLPTTPPESSLPSEPMTALPTPDPGAPGLSDAPTIPQTPAPTPADSPELWTQYPHARREMIREVIFLAPAIGLGLIGAWAAWKFAGPWTPDPVDFHLRPALDVPLWLAVLSGVLMGYLIGGGLVWGMRILGSLAFGKEALGLGDVHLMAAVGACLGWIDSTLAFFAAAFVGVLWAVLSKFSSGAFQRHMPFGPYLAIGTVLVWFAKPGIERLLGMLAHARGPIPLP